MRENFELPSGLRMSFANMLGEGRIVDEDLAKIQPELQRAVAGVATIRKEGTAFNHLSKDGAPEPVYFTRLPYPDPKNPNTPELLQRFKAFGEKVRAEKDVVIFCGIGGSYLGNKVLYDCFQNALWSGPKAKKLPLILFAGNNVDPTMLEDVMAKSALKAKHVKAMEKRLTNVLLVPISKSGTTLEPTVSFLYLYNHFASQPDTYTVDGAVVTDERMTNGPLNKLAKRFNWPLFDVPNGIGGRFSVLSEPGLVTAAVLGMDIPELLQGARDMDTWCQSDKVEENPALCNAVLKFIGKKFHGCNIEIFMPYAMDLKSLGEWYVQLLAESLGKRYDRRGNVVHYGRTPVVAIGTTDMHAQTQMHQDGIRDKVVQFLWVDAMEGRLTVKNPFPDIPEFAKDDGLDVGSALKAAMEANENALSSDKRLNARYMLPKLNEYYLGQIFFFLMLSIAYEGELADVDAFDQPGVEVYKRIMNKKLAER